MFALRKVLLVIVGIVAISICFIPLGAGQDKKTDSPQRTETEVPFVGIAAFSLTLKPFTEVDIPIGAQLLTVQVYRGIPYLYALINSELPEDTYYLRIAKAGEQINDRVAYIGSFHWGGQMYFVFELLPI